MKGVMNTMSKSTFSRRALLGAAGAAAAAPLLASCAGRSGGVYEQPSGQVPAKYANRSRVVLWSAFTANNAKMLQQVIEGFNDSQTDIFCEIQLFPGYDAIDSKLAASLTARQVPDIATLSDVNWNRYYLAEVLEPLKGYFDDDVNPALFNERFITEGQIRDDYWWLPWARSTPLFYYNKEIWSGAGLPDRGPKTFTEMREFAKQLKGYKYNGGQPKMRAYTGNDDWYFQGSSWAFGGGFSDGMTSLLTSEGTVASLEFDRAFIWDDKMGYLASDINGDLVAGVTAGMCNSTGALNSLLKSVKFELGAAFLPEEVQPGVPTGGSGLALMANASTERKQAAWEVIRYLMVQGSADWSVGTGYLPVTTVAVNSDKIKQRNKEFPVYEVAMNQLDRAKGPDVMRRYVNETIAEAKLAIQAVYASNANARQTLEDCDKALKSAVARAVPKYQARVA